MIKFGRVRDGWFIIALLLLSFAIRLYNIDTNLPNTYWHDENNYVETALRFGTGNLRPHTLQHGMLLPMLLFAEYGLRYTINRFTITGYDSADFLIDYIKYPASFYLLGRITSALFGIGCILLTYLISVRFYSSKRVANLSSFLFSISLVPFIQSKWTKASMISVFFLLAAFLIFTPLFTNSHKVKKPPLHYYILSGFFVGLAGAAKLYAVFGLCFIILGHFFSYRQPNGHSKIAGHVRHLFDGKMLICGIFLVLGFALGNPYALINPVFFYTNLSELHRELYLTNVQNPWLLYFTDHLKNAVGSRPFELLILISCAFFLFKRSKKELALLCFPAVLYLACMRGPGFAHYLTPAIPFLSIIVVSFLYNVFRRGAKFRNIFFTLVIIAIASPSIFNILRFNALISKSDTRTIGKHWIEKNLPENSIMLMEGCISAVPIQVPQLKGNLETLKRDLAFVKAGGGKGNIIEAKIKIYKANIMSGGKVYNLYKTGILDVQTLNKVNPDYVILSGYVDMDVGEREYLRDSGFYEERERLYAELETKYNTIKYLAPYPAMGIYFPLLLVDDFKRLESINLLKDTPKLLQGPEIKIFRKKKPDYNGINK